MESVIFEKLNELLHDDIKLFHDLMVVVPKLHPISRNLYGSILAVIMLCRINMIVETIKKEVLENEHNHKKKD